MARKESQFEALKKAGLIKSYEDKISVNQTALNDMVKDNLPGQNVLDEFVEISQVDRVEFVHSFQTFTPSSDTSTRATDLFSVSSSMKLNEEAVLVKAKKAFHDLVVVPSINKEDETVRFLQQNLSAKLSNRADVLNFFNNKQAPKNEVPSLRDVADDLYSRYDSFGQSAKTEEDYRKLEAGALKNFALMKAELEKMIVQFPQFIGYYNMFLGDLQKMLNLQTNPNNKQIRASSTTFLEMVEIARLSIATSKLALDPNSVQVSVISSGSKMSPKLKEAIDRYLVKTGKQSSELTIADYNIIFVDMYQDTDLMNQEVTQLAQKTGQWSGSETDTSVADIVYSIQAGNQIRNIGIDAKLSGEIGGRYTPSGGVKTILNEVKNPANALSSDLSDEFNKQLDIALYNLLFLTVTGSIRKEDVELYLNSITTYALLGSKLFIEHYRKQTSEMFNASFEQPEFLALRDGYIWYSDFFRLIENIYFDKKGGAKASIAIKNQLDTLKFAMAKYIERVNQNREMYQTVDDLEKLGLLPEDRDKIFNLYYKSGVHLGVDITNVLGKIRNL